MSIFSVYVGRNGVRPGPFPSYNFVTRNHSTFLIYSRVVQTESHRNLLTNWEVCPDLTPP